MHINNLLLIPLYYKTKTKTKANLKQLNSTMTYFFLDQNFKDEAPPDSALIETGLAFNER